MEFWRVLLLLTGWVFSTYPRRCRNYICKQNARWSQLNDTPVDTFRHHEQELPGTATSIISALLSLILRWQQAMWPKPWWWKGAPWVVTLSERDWSVKLTSICSLWFVEFTSLVTRICGAVWSGMTTFTSMEVCYFLVPIALGYTYQGNICANADYNSHCGNYHWDAQCYGRFAGCKTGNNESQAFFLIKLVTNFSISLFKCTSSGPTSPQQFGNSNNAIVADEALILIR